MIRVAIVDGNKQHYKVLANALGKMLFEVDDYEIEYYRCGEDLLLQNALSSIQLIFLEIHLPGMNGLETARQIRLADKKVDLIFCTEAAEYIGEGYRYHAFDFLIKPFSMGRLQDVMGRYIEERHYRPMDFLNITIQRNTIQLPIHQIIYLESALRKIIVHMPKDDIEFYGKLNTIEELLPPASFIRCHQSYLVNRQYVQQINSQKLVLIGGEELPVSRSYLKKMQQALTQ